MSKKISVLVARNPLLPSLSKYCHFSLTTKISPRIIKTVVKCDINGLKKIIPHVSAANFGIVAPTIFSAC